MITWVALPVPNGSGNAWPLLRGAARDVVWVGVVAAGLAAAAAREGVVDATAALVGVELVVAAELAVVVVDRTDGTALAVVAGAVIATAARVIGNATGLLMLLVDGAVRVPSASGPFAAWFIPYATTAVPAMASEAAHAARKRPADMGLV